MSVLQDPEQTETRVIHNLIDFTGKDVLEVGCGNGRLTWRFAERARSVLGLDPLAAPIETARATTPDGLRAKVTFREADVTTADLPTAGFDIAVLSWSLC
jgi:ubiquinone/menaquinone biosynthesis C-methylase UbiE